MLTTSPIWGHAPTEPIITKFGVRGLVSDVITGDKFFRDRLRGFRSVGVRKWGSPIDLSCRPYNRSALPCCLWLCSCNSVTTAARKMVMVYATCLVTSECRVVIPVVLHLQASNTNACIILHQITTTYSGACIEGAILAKCLLSTNLFALEDCWFRPHDFIVINWLSYIIEQQYRCAGKCPVNVCCHKYENIISTR